MLAHDSKHRVASASLSFAAAGEPASCQCMFLMRCTREARVPQAAAVKKKGARENGGLGLGIGNLESD